MKQTQLTKILVYTNVAIFALLFFVLPQVFRQNADAHLRYFSIHFGLVPKLFFDGYYWQPVTSLFMHASVMHILFNSIALYSLGQPIENTLGRKKFLSLYFISGLCGGLFILIFQSDNTIPTVGASAAITGLLGALAVFYPRSHLLLLFFPMKARTAALVFGVGSILFAIVDKSSNISHLGHLGGLIGGILYSRYALKLKHQEEELKHAQMDPFWGNIRQRTDKSSSGAKTYRLDPKTGRVYPED